MSSRICRLTPTELVILRHIAAGLTAEEIANETGRTKHTVNTQATNILRKLHATSRAQAVAIALCEGWIEC